MDPTSLAYVPDLDRLVEELQRGETARKLIGVSGYSGSGKTTLSRLLAERLNTESLSIDEFATAIAIVW